MKVALLAAAAAAPPNVLFIVVDDLAPVLSTYGHPALVTPNFERLAAQRRDRFAQCAARSSSSRPSRVCSLSSSQRHGRRLRSTRAVLGCTEECTRAAGCMVASRL